MTPHWIRLATPEDSLSLTELNNQFNGVKRNPEEVRQSMRNTNEIIAIVLSNDKPVGFGCAQYFRSFCYAEPLGEITELFVIEEARGQGLGRLIVQYLEDRLRDQGVRSTRVLTGRQNGRAIKTYENANYKLKNEYVFHRNILPLG